MIPANTILPLSIHSNLCANGETVECRLMAGNRQIAQSVYVNRRETDMTQIAHAFTRMLVRGAEVVA